MKTLLCVLFTGVVISVFSQYKNLPYYEIPAYPPSYTAGTVAARMIDGLGFRFHWATEGLRIDDLAYKPAADFADVQNR